MIRLLEITTDFVRRCDTSQLERIISEIEQNPEHVRQVQGTFVLTFSGFDDTKSIYFVPEVRSFLHKAFQQIPHLFYYLFPVEEFGSLLAFLAVHANEEKLSVTNGKLVIAFDRSSTSAWLFYSLAESLVNAGRFAVKMSDDAIGIISRILEPFERDFREQFITMIINEVGELT